MKRYSIAIATGFLLSLIPFSGHSQNVGIGTVTPTAKLHVSDGSFLAESPGVLPVSKPAPPISGAGRRIMWYPAKSAFRAGYVSGTQWDKDNIGDYSVAMGSNNTASGSSSTALGSDNIASGQYATVMGWGNAASGNYSAAIGRSVNTTGNYSIAIGYYVDAKGNNTIALGSMMSTDNFAGSCVIGDNGNVETKSTAQNQFTARFSGGYRFFTSNTMVAYLNPGQNSWSTTSDSTKKENFLHADGATFLTKIRNLRLGSWNYKGQDKASLRHYGPMAQEFYSAFGHDGVGTIGTDTSITTADIDGVMMIAIKQLILENEELKAESRNLKAESRELHEKFNLLQSENNRMISQSATLLQRLERLEANAYDNFISVQKGSSTK